MSRIRVVGLGLALAFAINAGSAAIASAAFREEAPEYGQCLRKPFNGIGNWKDAGCTVPKGPSIADHRYEWYPGFGEDAAHDPPRLITKPRFKGNIKRGTLAIFEVNHLERVSCTGEAMKGEITGPKTVANIVASFSGCTEPAGNPCQSKGRPQGRVVTGPVQGELGMIRDFPLESARDQVGLEIFVDGVAFECVGIPVLVSGSVIHQVTANAMQIASTEPFVGTGGEQKPDKFAYLPRTNEQILGGLMFPAPPAILETSTAGGELQESSLSLTTLQRNEMKIEISAIN